MENIFKFLIEHKNIRITKDLIKVLHMYMLCIIYNYFYLRQMRKLNMFP